MSRPRNLAAIVLAVALALALGSSAVLAPEADAYVSRSALTLVAGSVLVSHDGSSFKPAHEGDVIAAGDTIRTESGAAAEITYFEGSSVRLEADTQIVVESLRTEADGGTVIGMMQTLGRTWHVVTKLISGGSRYEVRTPSSTASVRGECGARDGRPGVDQVGEPARRVGARSCARDPSRSAGAAGIGAAAVEVGCVVIGSCGGSKGAAGGSARHHAAEGPHDDVEDLKAATERIGDL